MIVKSIPWALLVVSAVGQLVIGYHAIWFALGGIGVGILAERAMFAPRY